MPGCIILSQYAWLDIQVKIFIVQTVAPLISFGYLAMVISLLFIFGAIRTIIQEAVNVL